MAALDTNVLVRLLQKDDARQLARARALVSTAVEAGRVLFVPVSVVLELEWVLRSVFGLDKADVLATLSKLLSATELEFESEPAVELALHDYENGSAEFSDCLHVALARAAGHLPLWTFDRAAAKVDGARSLG